MARKKEEHDELTLECGRCGAELGTSELEPDYEYGWLCFKCKHELKEEGGDD